MFLPSATMWTLRQFLPSCFHELQRIQSSQEESETILYKIDGQKKKLLINNGKDSLDLLLKPSAVFEFSFPVIRTLEVWCRLAFDIADTRTCSIITSIYDSLEGFLLFIW
ncbi:hypothetical protein SDJN03_13853, partial [Cucurbita argyrosperma subsp. sororia]